MAADENCSLHTLAGLAVFIDYSPSEQSTSYGLEHTEPQSRYSGYLSMTYIPPAGSKG